MGFKLDSMTLHECELSQFSVDRELVTLCFILYEYYASVHCFSGVGCNV
jgi:hypothetical protein